MKLGWGLIVGNKRKPKSPLPSSPASPGPTAATTATTTTTTAGSKQRPSQHPLSSAGAAAAVDDEDQRTQPASGPPVLPSKGYWPIKQVPPTPTTTTAPSALPNSAANAARIPPNVASKPLPEAPRHFSYLSHATISTDESILLDDEEDDDDDPRPRRMAYGIDIEDDVYHGDDSSTSSTRRPESQERSTYAARHHQHHQSGSVSSALSYGSAIFLLDTDEELGQPARTYRPGNADGSERGEDGPPQPRSRREQRNLGGSSSMPNPSSGFGGRRASPDLNDTRLSSSFLGRSLHLSQSWRDSIVVKDLPVLRGARRTARAQMRGMATIAAAAATNRDSPVTPASALVEMGGSSRLHDEEMSGSSTAQSIFNTVNILLGLGLLSLPYALRCGGWIPGLLMLTTLAYIAKYTGLILSKCLDTQPGRLFDFADIGEAAFGPKARGFVSVLFISELYLTCVAFIILITDSLSAIFPEVSPLTFRFVAFVVCTLSTWVRQLKYISYASLVGIFASINLVVVVVYDGLTKEKTPGSILDPADTYAFPERWISCSLSFGIIMAGFAGHAVLPNIYLDMRDKSQFPRVLNISFGIAVTLYATIAVCGYLMFGELTLEEITMNLSSSGSSSNATLNTVTTWLIAFIPIPKFALTMAPVALALDQYVGGKVLGWTRSPATVPPPRSVPNHPPLQRLSTVSSTDSSSTVSGHAYHRGGRGGSVETSTMITNATTTTVSNQAAQTNNLHTHAFGTKLTHTPPRVVQLFLRTILAAGTACLPSLIPFFDVVLALLGSVFSVTVSIVIPAACYMKLYGGGRRWWWSSGSASGNGGSSNVGSGGGGGGVGVGSSSAGPSAHHHYGEDGIQHHNHRRAKILEEGADDEEDFLDGVLGRRGGGAASGSAGEGVGLLTGRVVIYRKGRMTGWEWLACWCLVVFGTIGAVIATIGAALPEARPRRGLD
ncbi:transmembrane amino acid transporter protein-domain-containing protein [Zopfochytrium polystomum]|nr:transmembrane amino acid transporter protein-domain-containing protein [Zopfochytrium polystomum]